MSQSLPKLIPLPTESKQDWQGLHPKKFRYAEKIHNKPKDQLVRIEGRDVPVLGRKHFEPRYSGAVEEKFCLKVFPDK